MYCACCITLFYAFFSKLRNSQWNEIFHKPFSIFVYDQNLISDFLFMFSIMFNFSFVTCMLYILSISHETAFIFKDYYIYLFLRKRTFLNKFLRVYMFKWAQLRGIYALDWINIWWTCYRSLLQELYPVMNKSINGFDN